MVNEIETPFHYIKEIETCPHCGENLELSDRLLLDFECPACPYCINGEDYYEAYGWPCTPEREQLPSVKGDKLLSVADKTFKEFDGVTWVIKTPMEMRKEGFKNEK